MTDKEFYLWLYDFLDGMLPIRWDFKSILNYELELLKEKGITKLQVANDLGFKDSSTISKWLNNKEGREPKTKNLKGLSNYLGVSIPYLLGKDLKRSTNHANNDLNTQPRVELLPYEQRQLINLLGLSTTGVFPEGKGERYAVPILSRGQLVINIEYDTKKVDRVFRFGNNDPYAIIDADSFQVVMDDILDYAGFKIAKYYSKQVKEGNCVSQDTKEENLTKEELKALKQEIEDFRAANSDSIAVNTLL